MELITVGQIAAGVALIVGLVKGTEYLCQRISAAATKWLQNGLEPTNKKIDELKANIVEVDASTCKNFLVRVMADTYAHYCDDLHLNTYIHDKYEKLKKAGKL